MANLGDVGQLFIELRASTDKLTADFNKANRKVGTFASGMKAALKGIAVTAGIAALAKGLQMTARAAIEFESSFAGVRKTVEASEAEFKALSNGLRDMATTIPVTVNELNRIAESAGQLGIEKENILGFTRVMADLGVTTNLSADQAATSIARFANVTGLAQEDFDRLGSSIVALGNNFATTEAEIAEMAQRLAGAGTQIGLTEAELLGMAAALTSVGINAESGGTAFSRVFVEMDKAVQTGGEKLAQFAKVAGRSTEDFADTFRNNASVAVTEFIEGLGTLEERGTSMVIVLDEMGLDAVRVADSLKRSANAGDLMRRAIKKSTVAFRENNALTKEAAQRYATSASKIKVFKNQINDLAITVGGPVATVFTEFLEGLTLVGRAVGFVVGQIKPFRKSLDLSSMSLVSAKDATAELERQIVSMSEKLRTDFGVQMVRRTNDTEAYHAQLQEATMAAVRFGEATEDDATVLRGDLSPALLGANEELVTHERLLTGLKSTYEEMRDAAAAGSAAISAWADATADFDVAMIGAAETIGAIPKPQEIFPRDEMDRALSHLQIVTERIAAEQLETAKQTKDALLEAAKQTKDALILATKDVRDAAGEMFDNMFLKGENVFKSLVNLLKGGALSIGRAIFQDVTAALGGPILAAFRSFFNEVLGGLVEGFVARISGAISRALGGGGTGTSIKSLAGVVGLSLGGLGGLGGAAAGGLGSLAMLGASAGDIAAPSLAAGVGAGAGGVGGAIAAFATNPVTIAISAALVVGLLLKKFAVGQGRRTADEFVQGFQNPFANAQGTGAVNLIVDAARAQFEVGKLTKEGAIEARDSVVELWDTFQNQAAIFAEQGATQAKVVRQAFETLNPIMQNVFSEMNEQVDALSFGAKEMTVVITDAMVATELAAAAARHHSIALLTMQERLIDAGIAAATLTDAQSALVFGFEESVVRLLAIVNLVSEAVAEIAPVPSDTSAVGLQFGQSSPIGRELGDDLSRSIPGATREFTNRDFNQLSRADRGLPPVSGSPIFAFDAQGRFISDPIRGSRQFIPAYEDQPVDAPLGVSISIENININGGSGSGAQEFLEEVNELVEHGGGRLVATEIA